MRAYKFLGAGGVARLSGRPWTQEAPGPEPIEPCRSGFHACRPGDLPYWIDEELWLVELAGAVVELDFGLVAEEAWLVERVAGWPDPVARRFVAACVARVCDRAAAELRAGARPEDAERMRDLSPADDLATVAAVAEELARSLPPTVPAGASHLLRYVADAATASDPAAVAYISAYAAGRATPAAGEHYGPGVTLAEAERRWQARWLSEALGLG